MPGTEIRPAQASTRGDTTDTAKDGIRTGLSIRRWKISKSTIGYLFIAPTVLYLLAFSIYPVLSTFQMSFTDVTAGEWHGVGFRHYVNVLQDPWFLNGLKNATIFTVASTVLHLLIGLVFALLINETWFSLLFRNFMRGALLLPYVFSTAASALMWSLLYHPFGLFNYLLLSVFNTSSAVDFLGTPGVAMAALIVVNTWKAYPFYMIGILGGLQSIPTELYEAARVDGASPWGRFRRITLPLLRPVLVPISTIDIITTFGHVDLIKLMTRGGPLRTTETISYYIYKVALLDGRLAYGAAISSLMLIALAIVAFGYLRGLSRGGETGETSF